MAPLAGHDQPAEPERAGRGDARSPTATPGIDFDALQDDGRLLGGRCGKYYAPFETGQLRRSRRGLPARDARRAVHEPATSRPQSLGLGDRWHEVCRTYAEVNRMFGDIVKVTPTSKVVGDMALFMVANNLTPPSSARRERASWRSPSRWSSSSRGGSGQPPGGFPEELQKTRPARPQAARRDRPGASLPPADFDASRGGAGEASWAARPTDRDVVSHLLYPQVFAEFVEHQREVLRHAACCRRRSFFYGMEPGEEVSVDIEPGKTLIIKFLTVGDPHADGTRQVFFELNGQPREVLVIGPLAGRTRPARPKAEPGNPLHVGGADAGAGGAAWLVAAGEEVAAGQKLLTLEAMKMETTLYAERAGRVAEVLARPHTQVEAGDLLVRV